jgi:hypothetical protein
MLVTLQCVLCGSQDKQGLLLYTSLTDWFLQPWWKVFTARYGLVPYITWICFVRKGLNRMNVYCHAPASIIRWRRSTSIDNSLWSWSPTTARRTAWGMLGMAWHAHTHTHTTDPARSVFLSVTLYFIYITIILAVLCSFRRYTLQF